MYYLTIDKTSSVPIYKQIEDGILRALDAQILRTHDVLPKEDDLCEFFSVSRTVVRQAYQSLEDQGVLYRIKGKGTFISATSHLNFTHNDVVRLDKVIMQKKNNVSHHVIFTENKRVTPATPLAVDFPIHSHVISHAHVLLNPHGPLLYIEDVFHQKLNQDVQRALQLKLSPFDEVSSLFKGATMTISIEDAQGPLLNLLKLDLPDTLMRVKLTFLDAAHEVVVVRHYVASGKNTTLESIIEEDAS